MESKQLTQYRQRKFEHFKERIKLKEIDKKIQSEKEKLIMAQKDTPSLDEKSTSDSKKASDTDKQKEELKTLNTNIAKLEQEKEDQQKKLDAAYILALDSAKYLSPKAISDFDTQDKDESYFLSTADSKEDVSSFSDKQIMDKFSEMDKISKPKSSLALSWISDCPKFQQDRLMTLYNEFLDGNKSNYTDESAPDSTAVITKGDCFFYSYSKGFGIASPFDKEFKLDLGDTVKIATPPDIKKYKGEHYICVYSSKNKKNLSDGSAMGYVKTQNITSKAYTADLSSTVQASQAEAVGLSKASASLFSKARVKLSSQNRQIESESKEGYANFHLDSIDPSVSNPSLMSDDEIAEKFKELKDPSKCENWIDAFFVHRKRMQNIYRKVTNGDVFDLDKKKPKSMMAKISNTNNANVYTRVNGNLERVGILVEGDSVLVDIDTSDLAKVNFSFINSKGKKYVPVTCIVDGKPIPSYVNAEFVTFVVDDAESIKEKCSHTQAFKAKDDAKDINNFEKYTSPQISSSPGSSPASPNMKEILENNPLSMSDKQIVQHIVDLADYDKIFEWADNYPIQTKRIRNIYNKIVNSEQDLKEIKHTNKNLIDSFSEEKPTRIVATVTRDKAHLYDVDDSGDKIKFNTSSSSKSPKMTSCGILKKGGKG